MATQVSAAVTANSPSSSTQPSASRGSLGRISTTSTGTTTSTPSASPAHQAAHTGQAWDVRILSVASRVPVPTAALTVIPPSAPRKTSASPSRSRSSEGRKPTSRSRYQEASGARVLPTAISTEYPETGLMLEVTASIPSAMPGVMRGPKAKSAATATPEGSHRGVTVAPSTTTWRSSPSRPAP